jgi:hypothetical protein
MNANGVWDLMIKIIAFRFIPSLEGRISEAQIIKRRGGFE